MFKINRDFTVHNGVSCLFHGLQSESCPIFDLEKSKLKECGWRRGKDWNWMHFTVTTTLPVVQSVLACNEQCFDLHHIMLLPKANIIIAPTKVYGLFHNPRPYTFSFCGLMTASVIWTCESFSPISQFMEKKWLKRTLFTDSGSSSQINWLNFFSLTQSHKVLVLG